MTRIALLGLGAMGRRMGHRLLAAGHELVVFNRSAGPAEALAAAGAAVAATPRDAAAGAEVVWSMVFDDTASRDVWMTPGSGALAGLSATAIAVESSTLSPGQVGELAAAVSRTGAEFVDAPVAGSRPQAEAGQLIFLAGGSVAAVDRLRPLLLTMGGAVHRAGGVASGAWLKLAVNAMFATQVVAVAEQLSMLRRAGLDMKSTLEILRQMPTTSPAAAGAAALMLAGDYSPQAPVELIAKDLAYAMASGRQSGSDLPLTAAVLQRFDAAAAAGWGAENLVAVSKLYD